MRHKHRDLFWQDQPETFGLRARLAVNAALAQREGVSMSLRISKGAHIYEGKAMNAARTTLSILLVAGTLVVASNLRAGESDSNETGVRNDFSNATLNDRYGFHTLAFSLDSPFAISGFYRFDGNGGISGRDVTSAAGTDEEFIGVEEREYEGTYEVRSDGTGTLTLDISPDFQPTGHFTIVEGGEAIEIIFAVEGNANAFTLRKQNTR